MKVWTYVIACDKGGAPNFEPPSTTVTVCKPRIRKSAEQGDLVLAFNGKHLSPAEPRSVRWARVVSEVIPLADYWNDPRFEMKKPGRPRKPREIPDNIYRPIGIGQFEQVDNETHKRTDMARDLGGLNALVFSPSWHFDHTIAVLPECFHLRMNGGRRGHRKSDIDESVWLELKAWLDASSRNSTQPIL